MGLDIHEGTFTRQAGTGTQAITAPGFTPKVVIFWGVNKTATGFSSDNMPFWGWMTAAAERNCLAMFNADADGLGVGATRADNTKCITIIKDGSPTISAEADFSSFDANGFTIDWVTNDGTLNIIHYLALGGSDITNAFVGNILAGAATGDKVVTDPGFQPDIVFAMGMGKITTLPSNQTKAEKLFFGVAASSTQRGVMGWTFRAQVGGANKVADYNSGTDFIVTVKSPTQNETVADFVSMDALGFTFNYSTAKGDYQVLYLCIQGDANFEVEVGTDTQRTTAGIKATPTAFEPQGLMLWTNCTTGGGNVDGHYMTGGADGTRESVAGGTTEDAPSTDTKADDIQETDAVIEMVTFGQPPTLDAEANLDGFNATDFTLNWTTADGTARQFVYWVFKGAAAAGMMFTQAVGGSMTPSGALVKSTGKQMAGSMAVAGVLARRTGKAVAGAMTAAGALVKKALKQLAGSMTPSGALATSFTQHQAVEGSMTPAGALVKKAGKQVAGSMTPAGALVRKAGKQLAGSMTAAGALVKKTLKQLAGSMTASGILTTVKTQFIALAGSMAATGALVTVFMMGSGGMMFFQAVGGSMTPAGALARKTLKQLAGTTTPSGALVRLTQKRLAGSLTPAGVLVRRTGKRVAGSLSAAGALVTRFIQYATLGGTLTPSGALVKRVGKALGGSLTPAGALVKRTGKRLAGALTPTGALAKRMSKALAGSLTITGTLATILNPIVSTAGNIILSLRTGGVAATIRKGLDTLSQRRGVSGGDLKNR